MEDKSTLAPPPQTFDLNVKILRHSPAPSDIDSLAGIEDLDAFLASKGELSRFPTPPPLAAMMGEEKKGAVVIEAVEIDVCFDDDENDTGSCSSHVWSVPGDEDTDWENETRRDIAARSTVLLDHEYIAGLFSTKAGTSSSTFYETVLIQDMLRLAQLPPETLALSLNILDAYNTHLHPSTTTLSPTFISTLCSIPHNVQRSDSILTIPADLLTVSILALAVCYLEDYALSLHYWSRHVTWDAWTPQRLEVTRLHVLQTLDWRIHGLATPEAMRDGVAKLIRPAAAPDVLREIRSEKKVEVVSEQSQQRRLNIKGMASWWANGQLTPEASPPVSALKEKCEEVLPSPGSERASNSFLPLL